MKRMMLALELFFQKHLGDEDQDLSQAWEQMACDIKGTIYSLIALFELVALTSYVSIDTINIVQNRLDHINNLGGIVGAIFAEWFLGSVGVVGYVIVLMTGFVAYTSFRGIPFRDNLVKLFGAVLGSIFLAITCRLLWFDQFPQDSLMQGGIVGKVMGDWLLHYFHLTGALLLVIGAFLITAILTTGMSIVRTLRYWFEDQEGDEEDFEDDEEEEEAPVTKKKKKTAKKKKAKKKKPAKKAKKASSEEEDELDEEEELDEDEEAMLEMMESEDGEEGDEEAEEEEESAPAFGFQEMPIFKDKYALPSPRLLKLHGSSAKKPSRGQLKKDTNILCEHLLSFNITGKVTDVSVGPVLTTYEYKPSAGIKLKSIAAVQEDLGIVMGTKDLRIVAPIPGKTVVGIEIPRPASEVISLKELVNKDAFYEKKMKLPIALGKSTDGKPVFGDLTAMPHLLVAGATGSGKSVFVNCLITGFLYRMPPSQLRMILIDPKMLELVAFEGIPHLIGNVITNNDLAYNALAWAVEEMERRYQMMAQTGSKNIDSYNSKNKGAKKLPYIVVVIDELADLMMSVGEQVEVAITRLAQKARAAGIHLVIATQRPSTDVITGLIKANIPSRLSFKVPSAVDSRTILDSGGAESLMGRGDSLMIRPAMNMQRIHGAFVSEDELKRVVKNVKGGKKNHNHLYLDFSQPVTDPELDTKKKKRRR